MERTRHAEEVKAKETLVDTLSADTSSPLRQYQEIFVGTDSFVALLRYELLTLFLTPLPGALGYFLRSRLYPKLFAAAGRGIVIGPNVTLRSPTKISLGSNVYIDRHAMLDAKGAKSSIRVGDSVLIGSSTILSCAQATITVGSDVSTGPNCYIRASRGPVTLGSFVTIGTGAIIISGSADYRRLDIPMIKQDAPARGISIADDVWIGVGAKIIDGVSVGEGSVIGAGAVVIGDVPDYSIVAGVPAKIIRTRR
jgi:acetyltransferase-like isoleucine patch superfamily enzyme